MKKKNHQELKYQKMLITLLLFVCVRMCLENFHSYGDVTTAIKPSDCKNGPREEAFAQRSWPLSSEASLACNSHRRGTLIFK